MKTKTINIYSFSELSDDAKENARQWWRNGIDFAWGGESLDSIKKFCEVFNLTLKDWSVGPYSSPDYTTDATNANFRGKKLNQFTRDAMPTGYCLDCDLYVTFYDTFKKTGDAKQAFEDALYQAFKSWRDDMEYQLSDESVDEMLSINGYEFDESGDIA